MNIELTAQYLTSVVANEQTTGLTQCRDARGPLEVQREQRSTPEKSVEAGRIEPAKTGVERSERRAGLRLCRASDHAATPLLRPRPSRSRPLPYRPPRQRRVANHYRPLHRRNMVDIGIGLRRILCMQCRHLAKAVTVCNVVWKNWYERFQVGKHRITANEQVTTR